MLLFHKGKNVDFMMRFKEDTSLLYNRSLYSKYYQLYDSSINRKTDLNKASIDAILSEVSSKKNINSLLDVGCGSGYLLSLIHNTKLEQKDCQLEGYDINPPSLDGINTISSNQGILEDLDEPRDVIITTHLLEHVTRPYQVFQHLLSLANKLLIIVVPRQEYFKYTFDLHLSFFPSEQSLRVQLGLPESANVDILDGDFFITIHK
jgi:2-polyprenyl-3-methyl-5-hydroxy-6-metoxy-1,4-benzoquinol methylase